MIILRLYWEFFKTGLFTVGGGMASLPFLYDISDKTGWFSHAQLADMIAVSESTPGPIGINMATYVGQTVAGVPGAVIATLGFITPCVIIALIVASVLHSFRNNKYVDAAFYGLRPCSIGLIAAAGVLVVKISLLNIALFKQSGVAGDIFRPKAIILAILLVIATRYVKPLKKLHPVAFIAISAVVGAVFGF